jgi:UDP-glucuronate 4-epimerase
MLEGQPIPVFGDGSTRRDYTYVDDVVDGIRAALRYEGSQYEVINLGNNQTVSLREMIASLEDALGVQARIERLPEQPGDVPQTWADITKAQSLLGYQPKIAFRDGVRRFSGWLLEENATRL